MSDSRKTLAVRQIRNAANNLHSPNIDYRSVERKAYTLLLAITNGLTYGNMYGPQIAAAAEEFSTAIKARGGRVSTGDDFKPTDGFRVA